MTVNLSQEEVWLTREALGMLYSFYRSKRGESPERAEGLMAQAKALKDKLQEAEQCSDRHML